jgi:hypothetical protein
MLSYKPAANAARFAAGLRAWWWPGTVGRQAPAGPPEAAPLTKDREAVHRWEDEGGNVK